MAVNRWTEEEDKALERLVAEGKSAGVIAQELRRPRNSVIGRAFRNKIKLAPQNMSAVSKKIRVKAEPKPRPVSGIARVAMEHGIAVRLQARAAMGGGMPPEPKRTEPDPATRVSFMGLKRHQCRYPLWDDSCKPALSDMFFCGAVKDGESSYCAHHRDRTTVAAPVAVSRVREPVAA
jgi:hypothetical protein